MADSLDIQSNQYNGKYAAKYLSLAIMQGVMIEKELLQVFTQVKQKMQVPTIKLNGVVAPYTAAFTPNVDSVVYSDKTLDPKALSVHLEFDIDVLEQLFLSAQMKAGMANSSMPLNFQSWVVTYVSKQVSNQVDKIIFLGDTASGDPVLAQLDGFVKLFTNDADVVDVVLLPLTKANIIGYMEAVYNAQSEGVSDGDRITFMSVRDHKILKTAIAAQTVSGTGVQNETKADYLFDIDNSIAAIPNFPNDTIISTTKQNLALGTDLTSDMNTFQIINLSVTTGDRKIRMRMDFKLDVNYGFGEDVVLAS